MVFHIGGGHILHPIPKIVPCSSDSSLLSVKQQQQQQQHQQQQKQQHQQLRS
jgi:hypothetical protein